MILPTVGECTRTHARTHVVFFLMKPFPLIAFADEALLLRLWHAAVNGRTCRSRRLTLPGETAYEVKYQEKFEQLMKHTLKGLCDHQQECLMAYFSKRKILCLLMKVDCLLAELGYLMWNNLIVLFEVES